MNVLLISLQRDLDVIGLKCLHYYLRENGHSPHLLYLPNFSSGQDALKNIGRLISDLSPKLIGVSLMSVEYHRACDLTKYLKVNFKSVPVLWGGIHPTIAPETCLDYADYVCIGEGEGTILDLSNAIERGEDVTGINNLCFRLDGRMERNPLNPLIDNLDELPVYDHIPVNAFIQVKSRISPLTRRLFRKYTRYRGITYSVITSRGCPFSCTYCCNNFVSRLYQSRKIRRRSIRNIISELERAMRDNPELEYINFQDDCFLACGDEYLGEFCKGYKDKIAKPFVARSIPIYITKKRMNWLKGAGLAWISLGLQSGSDRVLKDIYKRKSLAGDFLKAAKIIKDFNVAAFYDVILDNPFETEEDKIQTIQTLMDTPRPFYTQYLSLVFYLGTELYERASRECPEQIEDILTKDYFIYDRNVLNDMIRLATFLGKRHMNAIVRLYKQGPSGFRFRSLLFISRLLSLIVHEPVTYFQVIRLSMGGSLYKTLRVMPGYFGEGLMRYFSQFKGRKGASF